MCNYSVKKNKFFDVTLDVGRTFFEGFNTCHANTPFRVIPLRRSKEGPHCRKKLAELKDKMKGDRSSLKEEMRRRGGGRKDCNSRRDKFSAHFGFLDGEVCCQFSVMMKPVHGRLAAFPELFEAPVGLGLLQDFHMLYDAQYPRILVGLEQLQGFAVAFRWPRSRPSSFPSVQSTT